jgi:hypothetical protein
MKKQKNKNRKTEALEKETGRHKNSANGRWEGKGTNNTK